MRESPAERVARKEKQAREAPANMARYRQEQQATLDKTVRLRAQRLALPGMENPVASSNKCSSHRPLAGLHQGTRR